MLYLHKVDQKLMKSLEKNWKEKLMMCDVGNFYSNIKFQLSCKKFYIIYIYVTSELFCRVCKKNFIGKWVLVYSVCKEHKVKDCIIFFGACDKIILRWHNYILLLLVLYLLLLLITAGKNKNGLKCIFF
jgi:hypothetical protein